MHGNVDQLLGAYEQGHITRRGLLSAIASMVAAGTVTATAQSAPTNAPRVHVNHVNLRVGDLQRSMAFYKQFFGFSVRPAKTYQALDCGNGTFLSLQTKADVDQETFRLVPQAVKWAKTPTFPAGTLEHVCLEVEGFDLERTAQALKAGGYEVFVAGNNLFTADPDGILLQIVDSKFRFAHEL